VKIDVVRRSELCLPAPVPPPFTPNTGPATARGARRRRGDRACAAPSRAQRTSSSWPSPGGVGLIAETRMRRPWRPRPLGGLQLRSWRRCRPQGMTWLGDKPSASATDMMFRKLCHGGRFGIRFQGEASTSAPGGSTGTECQRDAYVSAGFGSKTVRDSGPRYVVALAGKRIPNRPHEQLRNIMSVAGGARLVSEPRHSLGRHRAKIELEASTVAAARGASSSSPRSIRHPRARQDDDVRCACDGAAQARSAAPSPRSASRRWVRCSRERRRHRGGQAQLEPANDINLHFTGDIHA